MAAPERPVSESDMLAFRHIVKRLQREEPIQYITGQTFFYGLTIKTIPAVLIPRPETEELVEWIVETYRKAGEEPQRILDLGTGSGCIALALKKAFGRAAVTGTDISEEALKIASENAKLNRLSVHFEQDDMCDIPQKNQRFDLLVSNPPYVLHSERKRMSRNVLNHEPHTALFVDDGDPLKYYRCALLYAEKVLTPGGRVFFEINERMENEMAKLIKSHPKFWDLRVKYDIRGVPRMISCIIIAQ